MPEIKYLGPPTQEDLEPLAEQIAQSRGIPVHIFKGYINHESGWDIHARNPKSSATGLIQFLDKDARSVGMKTGLGADDDRYNPRLSLEKGADYLLQKYEESGRDWRKAVKSMGEGTESYMSRVTKSISNFCTPGRAEAAEPPSATGETMVGGKRVKFLGPSAGANVKFVGPGTAPLDDSPSEAKSKEDDYDYKSAAIAGVKPDTMGHWPSRVGSGEQEGLILKSENHSTFDKTILGEAAAGNVFYRNKKDGKLYSFPPDAKLSADFEKETKYQSIINKIQSDLSKDLETAVMAGEPIAALVKPGAPAVGPEIAKIIAPSLPGAGFAVGGIVGGAGGLPTGGVVSAPGAVAGAGLGYAMGKRTESALEQYAGTRPPETIEKAATEVVKDIPTGVTMEMGGAIGGKVLQKGIEVGGKIVKPLLGRLSGVGTGFAEEALKGSEQFYKGLRGKISGEEIVNTFKSALQRIKEIRGAYYQKRLADIATTDTGVRTIGKPYEGPQIDLKPINLELRKLMENYRIKVTPEGELDFSHMAVGDKGRKDVEKMIEAVWNWKDNTPLGIDALKRYLGDFYSESSQARAFSSSLYKSAKDTLTKAIPEYAEMTKGYSEASRLIQDIEKGLMLKQSGKFTADQTLRRLTSSMRDSFEMRGDLVRALGEGASEDLQGLLAGYAGRSVLPVGMAGSPLVLIGEIAIARFFNPKFWPILAVSSPRVQAEFLGMFGKALKETSGASLPVAKMVSYLALRRDQEKAKEDDTYQFLNKARPRGEARP